MIENPIIKYIDMSLKFLKLGLLLFNLVSCQEKHNTVTNSGGNIKKYSYK